ncbi:MAG: ATPase [Muribaculaceae bacterium]|nr:ATPase [Muribaculaceae bacterium]
MRGTLIADAGATKTDWAFLLEKLPDAVLFKTEGINPVHQSLNEIQKILEEVRKQIPEQEEIAEIFFYGAGCVPGVLADNMKFCLETVFCKANVSVESDLTGTCRSLFGDNNGVAAILGTGSNSCLYENGIIIDHIPPLGFILGDEGSGCALGKRLIGDIFKKQLSPELGNGFFKYYNLSLQDLISKIYSQKNAARYLASFVPFIKENIHNPEIYSLVYNEFQSFFNRNILHYYKNRNLPLGLTGSVAVEFENILVKIADEHGIEISKVTRNPLNGLIRYHCQYIDS